MQLNTLLPDRNITLVAFFVEIGSLALALIIGILFDHWPLQTITFSSLAFQENLNAVLWGFLATVPMFFGILLTERSKFRPFVNLKKTMDELVVPIFSKLSILHLAIISLAAGIGEEVLFRGLIQDWLAEELNLSMKNWPAILIAATIFGLAHSITKTYIVMATLMGIYLGWIFYTSGNLLVPITAHACYDFLALVYLVKIRKTNVREINSKARLDSPPEGLE